MRHVNRILPRRNFLRQASVVLALLVVEVSVLSFPGCSPASSAVQKAVASRAENVAAKVTIVSDKEPGEPLIVSGTIYAPDGKKPLEGITLYVYQTDATGMYSTSGGGGDNRNTRIHGVMRTGADGRYEFRTIRPASYPGTRISAHIHALFRRGVSEIGSMSMCSRTIHSYRGCETKFRDRGSFSPV